MGERLNFEIVHNGETIMNCYRHWGAYTVDAAEYAANFVEAWKRHCNDDHPDALDDDELLALRLIDSFTELNAGFNDVERNRLINAFCQDYPTLELAFREGNYQSVNRDEGLLSITKEGIAETEYWEEGRVTYDIDSDAICFEVVCFEGESYDDFRETCEDEEMDMEMIPCDIDIPWIEVDLDAIPAEKMEWVANELRANCDWPFKTIGGYYSAING